MTSFQQTASIQTHQSVYNAFCIGIAGSLVFWPLLCSLLIIFLSAYWIVFAKKQFSFKDKKSRMVILFCALYVPVIIGTLYSQNMDEAFAQLRIKIPLLALPVVFGCTNILNERICNNTFRSFVACTFAGCVFCIAAGLITFMQSGSAEQLQGHPLVILKDTSPFVFAFFCLLSVAYLLNEIYSGKITNRTYKIISVILLICLSLFIILIGNRNILFCWIIIIVFFCFLFLHSAVKRILFLCLLICALIAAVFINPTLRSQWNDMTDFSEDNTISLDADRSLGRGWGGKAIRVAIWECSADIIKKHWLTGVGTGDVQPELQNAYENRKFYFASRHNRYNAHNQYIQETIAFGIAGLCIFLSCLLIPLITHIRSAPYRLYTLFLICIMIICVTDSILEISKGLILYAFFNSLFAFTRKDPT